ncbi:hypothetical protein [Acetobacterium wieringae]|uniref:hypothetical protein n=1 Tax=Acetobacterium wieringae TaxID=52694 RepID=UPI0020346DCD|nr:hypothetical protein [Acetobacterium wieringae]URN85182.1 hypothetical protein CHL1_000813 [Acetobacterium wieringae]
MNKDLYIQLLEEHVDDLTTAAKIDTVLTSRKNCLIKRLTADLAKLKDFCTAQDELLSKVADTAMDYQDDLITTKKALETVTSQRTMANRFNVEQQGVVARLKKENEILNGHNNQCREIIRELKKEKFDMGMELEKLKKENEELGSQILDFKEDILNLQEQLGV